MQEKHKEKFKRIGESIKQTRRSKGMTQEQLAEKVGISISYISKIEAENTEKSFSLETLFDIAEALEVNVMDLLKF